jgi:DNA polymerase IIIc chi subunit
MKQQTAVEYLFEQLWDTPKDKFTWHTILKKAKGMEKQQIEIAFEQGMNNSADYYIPISSGEKMIPECENYYKETYENK